MNTNHDKSRIVTKNKTKTEKTERLKPISLEQGEKMAKELKCAKYVECSAKSQVGLKSVFDEALLTHFEPFDENDKKKKSIFARLLPKCLKPKVFA